MNPSFNNQQRKKLSNILIGAAISLAVLILLIIIISSVSGNGNSGDDNINANVPNTATPYGTEVVTPFYTPTRVPTIDPASLTTPTPSPAPTPTMVPLSLDKTYKKGDNGDDILIIQQMLIDIGFDPGETDGQFGGHLKSAIINFQKYAEIDDDGIAGPTTINKIINNWKQMSPKPLDDKPILYGTTIGIDAGYQKTSNTAKEPLSPNSSTMKAKATTGATGQWTDVNEYVIDLQIALRLKLELEALGATVIMTREDHNADISNVERAQMMNNAEVDFWLRIQANSNKDEDIHGLYMLIPADGSMDTKDSRVYSKNSSLANALLATTIKSTGAKNLGVKRNKNLAGFNWSKVPVCTIKMGYLTNEDEDELLVTKEYQQKIIQGLVDGIVNYFGN